MHSIYRDKDIYIHITIFACYADRKAQIDSLFLL